MSVSDSFIDEVNEEVRRDRLFALIRRYGWIAALAVVIIVGGAAWNEYRKFQVRTSAQAFGDGLLAALDKDVPEARAAGLAAIEADEVQSVLLSLLTAGERLADGDREAAAEALRALAGNQEAPAAYTDLAALKLVLLGDAGVDADTRAQFLERLAQPGAPYRPLALEQQAIALAIAGDFTAARARAETLLEEPGLTQNMVRRVSQLMLALDNPPAEAGDATPPPASTDDAASEPSADGQAAPETGADQGSTDLAPEQVPGEAEDTDDPAAVLSDEQGEAAAEESLLVEPDGPASSEPEGNPGADDETGSDQTDTTTGGTAAVPEPASDGETQ